MLFLSNVIANVCDDAIKFIRVGLQTPGSGTKRSPRFADEEDEERSPGGYTELTTDMSFSGFDGERLRERHMEVLRSGRGRKLPEFLQQNMATAAREMRESLSPHPEVGRALVRSNSPAKRRQGVLQS